MTEQQIKWAAQHDWFKKAEAGMVFAYDDSRVVVFNTFADLRIWAGY